MNAYELADGLRTIGAMPSYEVQIFLMKTETMLRQQADKITELEFQIRMNEMKYLEKIEELEAQLREDEPMKICSLIGETYQVVKNDEVFHQGSLESCESFIRVFNKG